MFLLCIIVNVAAQRVEIEDPKIKAIVLLAGTAETAIRK